MTLYWYGNGGNWSDCANHWSNNSGNSPNSPAAAVPGIGDDVVFDGNSGSGICTIDASSNCANISFTTTTITLAGAQSLSVYGNILLASGMGFTYSGTIVMKGVSGTKTISTNTVVFTGNLTFNGAATFQLSDDLSMSRSTASLSLTAGTFDPNGRTVSFASSCTGISIIGAIPFYNLTVTGPAVKTGFMSFDSNVVISNNLTLISNSAINRILLKSNSTSQQRTITCNGTVNINGCDLQDIVGAGSATWDFHDTTTYNKYVGNCGGNSGIVFTPYAPQYWKHGASASYYWDDSTRWFLASNGQGGQGRTPLPQDDVIFDANSFSTTNRHVISSMPRLGKSVTFAGDGQGAVIDGPTVDLANDVMLFGSLTLTNGMNITGNFHFDFQGRASSTLISAGNTLYHILVNMPSYVLTLQDDLVCSATGTTITWGTLDMNNHNMTLFDFAMVSGGAGACTLYMRSGILELTRNTVGSIWSTPYNTNNAVIYPGTSTLKINSALGSAQELQMTPYTRSLNNLILTGSGNYKLYVVGASIGFNDMYIDTSQAAKGIKGTAGQTITATMVRRSPDTNTFTVVSDAGSSMTFTKVGGGVIHLPYSNITYVTFNPDKTWYFGASSTNGGNNTRAYWTYPYQVLRDMYQEIVGYGI
jgi:hypothetical protein